MYFYLPHETLGLKILKDLLWNCLFTVRKSPRLFEQIYLLSFQFSFNESPNFQRFICVWAMF